MDLYPVRRARLFGAAKTVAAGTNEDSQAIDLRNTAPSGMFALFSKITGTGACKITYKVCSTKGGTYFTPADAVDIETAQTVGSIWESFEPELTPFIIINFEETSSANAVVIDETSELIYQ